MLNALEANKLNSSCVVITFSVKPCTNTAPLRSLNGFSISFSQVLSRSSVFSL